MEQVPEHDYADALRDARHRLKFEQNYDAITLNICAALVALDHHHYHTEPPAAPEEPAPSSELTEEELTRAREQLWREGWNATVVIRMRALLNRREETSPPSENVRRALEDLQHLQGLIRKMGYKNGLDTVAALVRGAVALLEAEVGRG